MILKKQKGLVSSILVMVAVSCTNSNVVEETTALELKNFSFQLPSFVRSQPIINQKDDSSRGNIIIKEMDTIQFNFGYSIDNLSEKDPVVIYFPYNEDSLRSNLDTNLVDPQKIIYTKKIDPDIDEFRKQNVYYEIVSGYVTKITVPRQIKEGGVTGMYVDSLLKDSGGRLKFNFYSKNLDSLNNKRMIEIIRSIKFHIQ